MGQVLPSDHPNPPKLVWLQKREARYVIAMTQQPQVRCVPWELDCPRRLQYLAMPDVVFVIGMSVNQLGGTFLYYAKSSSRELEDQLYHSNLPNVWANDRVCMGDDQFLKSLHEQLTPLGIPRERAFRIIETFWNGAFNDHIPDHFFALGNLDGRYRSVEDWATLSRRDPDAVLTTQWRPACSLGEAMERCWQSFGR